MTGALAVELWRVPTPLPTPVLTPAGPYDTFFHVVVVARRDRSRGLGLLRARDRRDPRRLGAGHDAICSTKTAGRSARC